VNAALQRAVARALEREKPRWLRPLGISLDPIRTLALPPEAKVIGVGGATLGGSGRTPLAIALARALAELLGNDQVAFVAHGHGGRVRHARRVAVGEDAAEIGDETAIAASSLRLPVFVGPRRETIELAARSAHVVVVDRLLQARPYRLACSLLAVNEAAPWGAFAKLPFGDLVAAPATLIAAADELVAIGGRLARERFTLSRPVEGLRVGALATLARPWRMRQALARLGVHPSLFLDRADHALLDATELANLDRLRRRHGLDAWVVDAKTAALMPRDRRPDLVELSHDLELAPDLLLRVCERAGLALPSPHAKLANGEARC